MYAKVCCSINTLSDITESPRPTFFFLADEYENASVEGASSTDVHCCLEVNENVFSPSAPAYAGLITFMLYQ